jgi:hypothetical protein
MSGTESGGGGRSVGGGGALLGLSLRGALKQAASPAAISTHSGGASAREKLTAVS